MPLRPLLVLVCLSCKLTLSFCRNRFFLFPFSFSSIVSMLLFVLYMVGSGTGLGNVANNRSFCFDGGKSFRHIRYQAFGIIEKKSVVSDTVNRYRHVNSSFRDNRLTKVSVLRDEFCHLFVYVFVLVGTPHVPDFF